MATRAGSGEEEMGCSFEEEWPEIARRLECFLAAKGVDAWLRADVIQDTATRLYPRWSTLDHSKPLWNLAVTVAVRIVHNHRRKESRIELVPEPVPIHRDDVHVRGVQRAQLEKTRSALQQLTDDQRRVLLAEVGEARLPAGTRNRINVLRLRARARLREALGPWAPSAIAIRFRHLCARIAHKRSPLEMGIPALANSLVNVAMVATLGVIGAAGPAANAASSVQADNARLPSSAEIRGGHLDHMSRGGRTQRAVPRAKDPAKEAPDRAPFAPSEGLGGWADRRRNEVRERGEEVGRLGEDGRELGEDVVWVGQDVVRLGDDVVRLGDDVVRLGEDVLDQLP